MYQRGDHARQGELPPRGDELLGRGRATCITGWRLCQRRIGRDYRRVLGHHRREPGEPGESGGDDGDDEGQTDPGGPDLLLFAVPECEVIPGGSVSGADVLTMLVAVRNGGPGDVSGLARVTIFGDTGLNASLNSGSAPARRSPRCRSTSHRGTTTRPIFHDHCRPDNETGERDESNNDLQITVELPSPPAATLTSTARLRKRRPARAVTIVWQRRGSGRRTYLRPHAGGIGALDARGHRPGR